jgi:glycosyltransferase involved in cell wall biosynthesis
VGIDATPLLGRPTGVGVFCGGALAALSERDDVETSAFAVSWRRRKDIQSLVPPGISTGQRAMPARPLHWAWGHTRRPPVEWFIGRCDVVHGPNFVVPPTRYAARVMSVWDLTVVLYPELCDPPTLEYPRLIRRAVGEGAWVHAPTRFVAEQVVAEFSVDPDRVRTVPLGIPVLEPPGGGGGAAGVDLPDGCHRYVLAIGTIEPRKDYPLLVSAFAAATAVRPDVALVVVGSEGWGSDRFTAAVEASPARPRIVRPGYLDDRSLGAVLRRASVLAYPSIYEGFGFPPLQAMAAGVPVVATAAGAVPEVVGDAALLVDPGDADGLAAALDRALDGGTDVGDLVARGRRRAAGFSWSACAEGLVGLYAAAAGDRPSGARRDAPRRHALRG